MTTITNDRSNEQKKTTISSPREGYAAVCEDLGETLSYYNGVTLYVTAGSLYPMKAANELQ